MEKETLKNIFNFLKKEDNINRPFLWMLLNKEPFTEEDLDVRGDLNLYWINPTSLPEGLKVRGNLFLEYCSKLTSLPEGLEVGYDLYLTESPNITSLPEGLKIHGDLFIADTKLEAYTDEELREMIKPGFIKGKIYREE
jgi:hypothetical protein